MITQITKLTTMASPAKSGRCQPPASAKKEKAAPLLYATTKLKKSVIDITGNEAMLNPVFGPLIETG